ncbi:MAG: thioredoxin domain-containing protein [Desulfobulbales bacterium]
MTNRLANEKSPYLLQHSQNPVDWYPWSDAAFNKAARENKPIFLSIGYSTCHWCHVMERESFEDEEVARLLNSAFVCIKVDREERPDIDNIYMTACTMMTGSGGWPLTIIMTPDKKPFFAGTYIPKQSLYGRLGLLDMVPKVQDIWHNRHDEVLQSSEKILEILQQQSKATPGRDLDHEILHEAFRELADRYDPVHGGFSKAPKFPTPHNLSFLLRYWKMTGIKQALDMVEHTLTAMRIGGIFDQIGFGFHRYSTDEKWLLPHFEKMLYDQALLAVAFLEAYQATGNSLFKQTVEEIFTYVLNDMKGPENGFYSAEDADSEGVEGKFYVWSLSELQKNLTRDELGFLQGLYHIETEGNFLDEATRSKTGENIFYLNNSPAKIAVDSTLTTQDFFYKYEQLRKKMFSIRKERIHPHKDDKILTDWNGLMIGALALGAKILDNETYLEAAEKGAQFILSQLLHNDKLYHRYRDGEAAVDGMLCDYAFVVWGLLELYAANFKPEILEQAVLLNKQMLELFWDDRDGGFFLTSEDEESLIARPKEIYDGALPSGNSIGLYNLLRLEKITADPDLSIKAKTLIKAFSSPLREVPSGYAQFLSGLFFALEPTVELVIVGDPNAPDTKKMLAILKENFFPNVVMLLKPLGSDADKLSALAPYIIDYTAHDSKATAYVCQNFSCKSPITDPSQLSKLLRN